MYAVTHRRQHGHRRRRHKKTGQQHDVVSRHYNKSRIEKELDLFFGSDDEFVDDTTREQHSPHKSSKFSSLASNSNFPKALLPPLSSCRCEKKSSSYIIDRPAIIQESLDPVIDLNLISDYCDTDEPNFLLIMKEDEKDKEDELVKQTHPQKNVNVTAVVNYQKKIEAQALLAISPLDEEQEGPKRSARQFGKDVCHDDESQSGALSSLVQLPDKMGHFSNLIRVTDKN